MCHHQAFLAGEHILARTMRHPTVKSASVDCMQIKELAQLSESVLPSVTRILFSKEDVQARQYIRSQMRAAGMEVRWVRLLPCAASTALLQ